MASHTPFRTTFTDSADVKVAGFTNAFPVVDHPVVTAVKALFGLSLRVEDTLLAELIDVLASGINTLPQ